MINQKKCSIGFYLVILIVILSATVSAARLPTVGGDNTTWGTILNNYLITLAGQNATTLNQTMVNGTNIYSSTINTTHIIDGTITDIDIADTTNLTLGQKITFGLGEIIDNIIDGWVTITGNLNVTKNITADYFIGDGSQLTGLSAGNASWNKSYADTLYADISVTDTNETNFVNELTAWNCTGTDKAIGVYANGTLICDTDTGGTDTNETDRFNNLTSWDCTGTDKVTGVYDNGTLVCGSDVTGGGVAKQGDGDWTWNDSTTLYWNETKGNETYIQWNNESTLNVNGSDYLKNYNTTTLEIDPNGYLTVLQSWLESLFLLLTGGTMSGVLDMGENNIENVAFINATDWTNVSITESQIVDLAHTTDTNETSFRNEMVAWNCTGTDKAIGVYANGTLICDTDTGGTDTNETDRFNNLTSWDCTGTDKVTGVYDNGTLVCGSDATGGVAKQGDGDWTWNDSTTIYWNETKGNETYLLLSEGVHCGNLTGNSSDLCTLTDTDTNTNCSLANNCDTLYQGADLVHDHSGGISAENISAGTFGAGDYSMTGDLVVTNGNVNVTQNYKLCLDGGTCSHYIFYNGTHTVIE